MKSQHISARVSMESKESYQHLAEQLGYTSLSEFVLAVLDSMVSTYGDEGWECRLVHVSEDRIVPSASRSAVLGPTSAFPVVAPDRFWRHVERLSSEETPD